MSNKALNAKNEDQVMMLVNHDTAKDVWRAEAAAFGKVRANQKVAARFNVSVSAVKAATYYW